MVYLPNYLGTLKSFLHISLNSAVELVQQLVVEVDEPVLLLRVPVLVVVVVVKVVKVHCQS